MPTVTEVRQKKLEQVRALLAKADSTEFPAEADAFRSKANALMTDHAIEQFEIRAAQDGVEARPKPESRRFDISWYSNNSRKDELWTMMQNVARHCRVKLVYWVYDGHEIPGVGIPSDLDYFDMLFTHLMLQMSKGLEPHPLKSKTMIENLVAMKEAGMKWERIGELLVGIGQLDHYNRNVGVKFTKLYTDYCDEHNRPRLRVSPSVYQRSYAEGFVTEIIAKLRKDDEAYHGTGKELAIRDINGYIQEETQKKFGMEPGPTYAKRKRGATDRGAFSAGREDGQRAHIINAAQGQIDNRRSLGS